MQTGVRLNVADDKVFEAYRELIEQVASDAYDAGAKVDDAGCVLVTSEAIDRVSRSAYAPVRQTRISCWPLRRGRKPLLLLRGGFGNRIADGLPNTPASSWSLARLRACTHPIEDSLLPPNADSEANRSLRMLQRASPSDQTGTLSQALFLLICSYPGRSPSAT